MGEAAVGAVEGVVTNRGVTAHTALGPRARLEARVDFLVERLPAVTGDRAAWVVLGNWIKPIGTSDAELGAPV